jgi:hypothetical protein
MTVKIWMNTMLTTYEVAWYTPKKTKDERQEEPTNPTDIDTRIRGPAATTFPKIKGWHIDGNSIELNKLTIKLLTYHLTQRIFKPPTPTQEAWSERLGVKISWHQIWKIKSFFATAADQITWLKFHHRNLYLAPHRDDKDDHTCPFCGMHENQLHLVKCKVIRKEFWTPIMNLMLSIGFSAPTHTPSFLAVGRLDENKAVGKNQSGILFISWRCLYAALVDGRIENKKPDLKAAYSRTLYLIIARITRYGEKWLKMDLQK